MKTSTTSTLHGVDIVVHTQEDATLLARYLLSESVENAPAHLPPGLRWAVLQATDTLVWAVWVPAPGGTGGRFHWATERAEAGPVQARAPRFETLVEVRAFGREAELLLWMGESGLQGRTLRNADAMAPEPESVPLVRRAYFLPTKQDASGQVEETSDPLFLRRTTGAGHITVTPRGAGVEMLDYLEECETTGCLRVAVTRFVCVFTG